MWIPDAWLIGDPHIGIDFDNRGTPLHRRGERRASQFQQLAEELAKDVTLNVMVGDLFDKPVVPQKLLYKTYTLYRDAALARPQTTFVLLAGNHDVPREKMDAVTGEPNLGSIHSLKEMLRWLPNVRVVMEPEIIGDIAFFPWEWGVTALEQVNGPLPNTAVGHWDIVSFGGDDSHLCPVNRLQDHGIDKIITGHYHLSGDYGPVFCTGSLQPYTHAEDPNGTMYRTLTLAELEVADPAEIRDLNIRVLLAPGEVIPDNIDCLSLTKKRLDEEGSDTSLIEVNLGDFKLTSALDRHLHEQEVPTGIQNQIKERLGVTD